MYEVGTELLCCAFGLVKFQFFSFSYILKCLFFNFQRKDGHLAHNCYIYLQYIPHWFSKFFIVTAAVLNAIPGLKKNNLLSFMLAEINKPTATKPNPHLLLSEHSAAAVLTDYKNTHTQIFHLLPTDVYI